MSEINSPFKDDVAATPSKDSSSNVSLVDGDPGYKKATPSANIPSRTSRHSNLDGGGSVGLTDSQSPDALVKRVS
jgi:hypothetical protein